MYMIRHSRETPVILIDMECDLMEMKECSAYEDRCPIAAPVIMGSTYQYYTIVLKHDMRLIGTERGKIVSNHACLWNTQNRYLLAVIS